MRKSWLAVALGFALTVTLAAPSSAVSTWDLQGGGVGGPTATFNANENATQQLIAAGFGYTPVTGPQSPVPLTQDSFGLGVVAVPSGPGQCFQIAVDECFPPEFIRFEFSGAPGTWTPVSIMLTGLTANDDWLIFGDDDGNFVPSGATLLALGTGDTDGNPSDGILNVDLTGSLPFKFLYAMPKVEFDCISVGACGTRPDDLNDDFRVTQVVGQTVPEPGTLLLLGLGVAAVAGCGFTRRRR